MTERKRGGTNKVVDEDGQPRALGRYRRQTDAEMGREEKTEGERRAYTEASSKGQRESGR